MTAIPHIIVELVHIEGPYKGDIQDFSSPEIVIGRHPDCHVHFPKEIGILSRKHARIVREGNRFKLIDQSTNGTFVNGKKVPEIYLNEGDVISFCKSGPKVSFLTRTRDESVLEPQPSPPPNPPKPVTTAPRPQHSRSHTSTSSPIFQSATINKPAAKSKPETPAPPTPPKPQAQPTPPKPQAQPTPPPTPTPAPTNAAVRKTQTRLLVQYGPSLKSFDVLPITLGKGINCEFTIDQSTLHDHHAQIFFDQDHYWIKDLTGAGTIMIDDVPIQDISVLHPDTDIALSSQGPIFRYLGDGRLVEVDEPVPEAPSAEPESQDIETKSPGKFNSIVNRVGSIFKKGSKSDANPRQPTPESPEEGPFRL